MNGDDRPRIDIVEGHILKKPKGPTVAVALHYDKETGDAPVITATGKGAIAEQILSLAFKHGVKVREDADLVTILSQVRSRFADPARSLRRRRRNSDLCVPRQSASRAAGRAVNAVSPEAQITHLAERLEVAERSFSLPLAGFESDVEQLCRDLLAMPREAAREYIASMEALIARLERLQTSVALAGDDVPRTGSKEASKAYLRLGPSSPPDEGTR